MQMISGGRRTGKTTKLLEMYAQSPNTSVIVVTTIQEKKHLCQELQDRFNLKLDQINIVVGMNVLKSLKGKTLYVDNLDWLLQSFGLTVHTGTYTGGFLHLGQSKIKEET